MTTTQDLLDSIERGYEQRKREHSGRETLPRDCQERIADLTERRQHDDTMVFTAQDAAELAAWETYLGEISK